MKKEEEKNPKKTFWGYNLRNIYNIYSYSSKFMQNQISHLNWLLLQIGWKYKIKKYFSCKRCAEKKSIVLSFVKRKIFFFQATERTHTGVHSKVRYTKHNRQIFSGICTEKERKIDISGCQCNGSSCRKYEIIWLNCFL